MITKNTHMDNVAGIVLAGGKSSRMGTCKALLGYDGRPLVEHMSQLLQQAGCEHVYISGAVPGYECIPDITPFDGPAQAMAAMLMRFKGVHSRLLFVPVDMPLIHVNVLKNLLSYEKDAFYANHPLPACLATGAIEGGMCSVKDLLLLRRAEGVPLPLKFRRCMSNCNTKEEWEALAS